MDIPFKLIIREWIGEKNGQDQYLETECDHYFQQSPKLYNEENVIIITENRDILMHFSSGNKSARLYIDTLDYFHSSICKEDEDENIYIEESEEEIVLFSNKFNTESKDNYYPFIPGLYRIYVTINEKKYYAFIKVNPKQLDSDELSLLRDELESFIENLAHDLINNESSTHTNNEDNNASLANQMLLLSQNYNKLMNVLGDIKKNPRSKLIKKYNLMDYSRAHNVDQVSLKYLLKHSSDTKKRILLPKNEITKNLPENAMMITCIKFFFKITKQILIYLNDLKPFVFREKEINFRDQQKYQRRINIFDSTYLRSKHQIDWVDDQEEIMRKLNAALNNFLLEDWVKEVNVNNHHHHAISLYLDSRYRMLYSLYRNLKSIKKKIQLDAEYAYTWKRTDKLYEMWCFVRVIEALKTDKLGFIPQSGWIFGDNESNPLLRQWHVPFLESKTKILFLGKNNSKIQLVYDEAIPKSYSGTDFDNPVYTEFPHNRPDCRLDYYQNDIYFGSIVMDFKYRPANSIGSVNNYNNDYYAFKQLLQYDHFASSYVGRAKEYKPKKREKRLKKPVTEVWVFYPPASSNKNEITPKNNWLTTVPYGPKEGLEKLENLIINGIDTLCDE